MFTSQHKVHLSDTDVTGQVYYAKPLDWLEWCRVDWFESYYGNFMDFVKKQNITFFPANVQINYKKPMFFGDVLTIEMTNGEIKKVSFVLNYTIKRQAAKGKGVPTLSISSPVGDEIVLNSKITMACFNPEKKCLSPLPDHLLSKLTDLSE